MFDFTFELKVDQLPNIVSGDKQLLKYILACLVENSIKRNEVFCETDLIKVTAFVTDDQVATIDDFSGVGQIAIKITDYGDQIVS
jgi:hypothetical protein